jgi:hypothetical protein
MAHVRIVPFLAGDVVKPKKGSGIAPGEYKVTAAKIDSSDEWEVQLAGLSIGDHGWYKAGKFQEIRPVDPPTDLVTKAEEAIAAFKALGKGR